MDGYVGQIGQEKTGCTFNYCKRMKDDDIENIYVMSGGGALFGWQFNVLCGLANAGLKPAMLGSTSTGTIGSFMFSKGLISQAHELCDEVYSTNAKAITKPGIAAISDGKIKVNWLKALTQLSFRKNRIVSLMDNAPLFETLTRLDTEHPGFPIPIFYNRVDMITGKLDECSTLVPMQQRDRIASMVASTTIPGVWPLVDGRYGDGGIREGSPLSAMFARGTKGKKKRIIVINCNDQNMTDAGDLSRIDRIIGRTAGIMMNETLINDLGRTQDRNKVAYLIDRYREQLPSEFVKELPYDYAPIYILEYKGPSGVFSFTPESLKEQRQAAREIVADFIVSLKEFIN